LSHYRLLGTLLGMATLWQMPQEEQPQEASPRGASKLDLHSPQPKSEKGDMVLSSPVSSCSASTRLPDSDSEEFLLEIEPNSRTSSFSEAAEQTPLKRPPRISLRTSGLCNALDTDLTWFRRCSEVSVEPWLDGEFTMVGRLAKSVLGEVRYLTTKDGTGVVAKVMPTDKVMQSRSATSSERLAWLREGDTPTIEDPWNEIAVLTFLQRCTDQCDHLLNLIGVFQDDLSTYVVTDYCDGGELFELVAYGDILSKAEVRRYISQLLRAVRHLHGHGIGHRDISLENVLLRRDNCVLMDFGQAVRLRAADGTELRYFAEAGKAMYRSPEMYVPRERVVQVICPSDATPGSVAQIQYDRCRCEVLLPPDASPGKPCRAEPFGYAVTPADIFACGVCAFVLTVGKPPWSAARDIDPTFSFVRRHGVPALLRQWRAGVELEPTREVDNLLGSMLRVSPKERPNSAECLRSPWLTGSTESKAKEVPMN